MALVNGGAHLDFRTRRRALTALHHAAIHQRKEAIVVRTPRSVLRSRNGNERTTRAPCLDAARAGRLCQRLRREEPHAALSFDHQQAKSVGRRLALLLFALAARPFDGRLPRRFVVDRAAPSVSTGTRSTRRAFALLSMRYQRDEHRREHAVARLCGHQPGKSSRSLVIRCCCRCRWLANPVVLSRVQRRRA
jgi:hypothetical protein